MIKIVELNNNKKDVKFFIQVAWPIYKNISQWVPPLMSDLIKRLTNQNPFWDHAKRKLFVALKDDKPVGRIAAIVDENHVKFHNEKVGFFGFYEAYNDQEVAEKLLKTAEKTLKDWGMVKIRGPLNPSQNDDCGFLLEGYETPPVIMMPYNPPYYHNQMEENNLRKIKDLYAYYLSTDKPFPEKLERIVQKLKKKKNIFVIPVNMKNLAKDVALIKEVYNSAWEKNWGFVPMTDKEFDMLVDDLKQIVIPRFALLAFIDNKLAGVSVTIPDYNQVLIHLNGRLTPLGLLKFLYYKRKINQARLLILGVLKEYRHLGVDGLMYYETFKYAKEIGIKGGEISWILEDNYDIIRPIEMFGAELYKKYRLYEKEIT